MRRGGLRSRHHAFAGQVIGNVRGRIDERDPAAAEFIRHRAQDGGIAAVVAQVTIPQPRSAPIRHLPQQPPRIVHAGLAHAAHHHRLFHASAAQQANPAADLQDSGLMEFIAQRGQLQIVLIPQADAADAGPGVLHAAGHQQRQAALAGDQAQRFVKDQVHAPPV